VLHSKRELTAPKHTFPVKNSISTMMNDRPFSMDERLIKEENHTILFLICTKRVFKILEASWILGKKPGESKVHRKVTYLKMQQVSERITSMFSYPHHFLMRLANPGLDVWKCG
jgi:hypothetical protein